MVLPVAACNSKSTLLSPWPATTCPSTADINVVLSFSGEVAGIPASESLVATGVDLAGACVY
jgi:hypothetical protein